MTSVPSVDVVIPTYGGWPMTKVCLDGLERQTIAHRVIVADNASQDDTVERLRTGFPAVSVVRLAENRGFGTACNRGIAAASGEIVVLLNNDVVCDPTFLERLVDPLRDDVAATVPVLLRPDRRTIDCVGLFADKTLAGFPRLRGHPASVARSESPLLLGPTGAAAAFRLSVLRELGGFDERIFLYGEDLDLALRLRAAGHRVALAGDAVAVHAGSATAGLRSTFQREHAGFSRGYLLRRYRILRRRAALAALGVELLAALGDAAISHDLAAARGRARGWRAARGLRVRALPGHAVDDSVSVRAAVRLRRADYAR